MPLGLQYLDGLGEEKAALSFCVTLRLPHLGQTALASRSSMWQPTSNWVPHCPARRYERLTLMAKFLLAYKGGGMGDSPESQQEAMDAWMAWFGALGADLVDGGAPFGSSTTIPANGVADNGASRLSGYTIINAQSLAAAGEKAQGCPVLSSGGAVEVYEAVPMG